MSEFHNVTERMTIILKREDEIKWLQHAPIIVFSLPFQVNMYVKKLHSDVLTLMVCI